jgi:hypothetical protein
MFLHAPAGIATPCGAKFFMKRLTRKPRTKSKDLNFDGAHMYGQPIAHLPTHNYAIEKLLQRFKNNLCLGCGKSSCCCKRKSNAQ